MKRPKRKSVKAVKANMKRMGKSKRKAARAKLARMREARRELRSAGLRDYHGGVVRPISKRVRRNRIRKLKDEDRFIFMTTGHPAHIVRGQAAAEAHMKSIGYHEEGDI